MVQNNAGTSYLLEVVTCSEFLSTDYCTSLFDSDSILFNSNRNQVSYIRLQKINMVENQR